MENTLLSKLNEMNKEKTEIKHKNMEEKEIIAAIMNGRENPPFKNMVITVKHNGGNPVKQISDIFAKHPSTLAVELLVPNDPKPISACINSINAIIDSDSSYVGPIYKISFGAPSVCDDTDPLISIFSFQAKTFTRQYTEYMEALSIYKTLDALEEKDKFESLETLSDLKLKKIDSDTAAIFYEMFVLTKHKIHRTIRFMKEIHKLHNGIQKSVIIDFENTPATNFMSSIMDANRDLIELKYKDCIESKQKNFNNFFKNLKYLGIVLDGDSENPKPLQKVLNLYCIGFLLSSGFELLYRNGVVEAIVYNE